MREDKLPISGERGTIPLARVHTLVIGSGAAGLNAALQLKRLGVDDLLIVTEGLQRGTSINAGSDKQTYYKLALCGADADSPRAMAETYYAGGSMHGDLALVEASVSVRAFMSLVNLGMPFPCDAYGQFVGYKTDHDPMQRATSIGPYTSREMCRALIREIQRLGVPIREGRVVAELLTVGEGAERRVAGALVLNEQAELEAYAAENVILAVGGPGGLYKTSVYPEGHTGGIGLGFRIGARAQSLPESQYGLASIRFRWNVSGTYMQVVPRFVSTAADGTGGAREFLRDYFESAGAMNSMVFLKGYQWPFDVRKASGGSSLIDILVYIETVLKGRRVFLDFGANPDGFGVEDMSADARQYLANSMALQETPIERLRAMNPGAIELYRDHGIDLTAEPLEVAVCAQHNNGGLAGNHWWESVNIRHLFPVGEVNGSHGVYRPGGSALNAGQVGGIRAAEYIAARYRENTLDLAAFRQAAADGATALKTWMGGGGASAAKSWREERDEFQCRMSRAAAHVRSRGTLREAVAEAREQCRRLDAGPYQAETPGDLFETVRNRQLCLAQRVYLEAALFAVESGVGSRGSAMVLDTAGIKIHPRLGSEWTVSPENAAFREQVQETVVEAAGTVAHRWIPRRPIPESDMWFETAWAAFQSGAVFDT